MHMARMSKRLFSCRSRPVCRFGLNCPDSFVGSDTTSCHSAIVNQDTPADKMGKAYKDKDQKELTKAVSGFGLTINILSGESSQCCPSALKTLQQQGLPLGGAPGVVAMQSGGIGGGGVREGRVVGYMNNNVPVVQVAGGYEGGGIFGGGAVGGGPDDVPHAYGHCGGGGAGERTPSRRKVCKRITKETKQGHINHQREVKSMQKKQQVRRLSTARLFLRTVRCCLLPWCR